METASVASDNTDIRSDKQVNIHTENDLHKRVVKWIRRYHPKLIAIPGLGELQNTDALRLEAWYKGNVKGTCDLMILNNHKTYRGMCIELKTPKGSGKLSEAQEQFLQRMRNNKFYILISNDYDDIVQEITRYVNNIIKDTPRRVRKRKTATTV